MEATRNIIKLVYNPTNQFPNGPINVKPEGRAGWGKPWEFDSDVYPQGGDFDHLIFQLQIAEKKYTIYH